MCLYILHTGHRRPCPAGKGCTAKITEREVAKTRKANWDKELARRLIEEGEDGRKLSDLEIAERVGANLGTLRTWKYQNGLTQPRKTAKTKAEPVAPAPTMAITPITEETPAQAVLGPVEVAFAVGGVEAKVAAPDIEQAVNAAERLLGLVKELRQGCQRERERAVPLK